MGWGSIGSLGTWLSASWLLGAPKTLLGEPEFLAGEKPLLAAGGHLAREIVVHFSDGTTLTLSHVHEAELSDALSKGCACCHAS